MKVNVKNRQVDIDATICIDSGPLELIACTKGSKEHEAIVSVSTPAHMIHLGLLIIGTKNGHPAMRRAFERKDGTITWLDIPPKGDPIQVSLVVKNEKGKEIERPIGDFITVAENEDGEEEFQKELKFPESFLFAGSHIIPPARPQSPESVDASNNAAQEEQKTKTTANRKKTLEKPENSEQGSPGYLADRTGNIISISTFGDEVLCLPGAHSSDNGSLFWHANPEELPEVDTKVILRLRPLAKPVTNEKSASKAASHKPVNAQPNSQGESKR